MIEFTVYGEPVAQGRPRFSSHGGITRVYDPAKSRDFKKYVRLVASQHRPVKLLQGPLKLFVTIYRPTLRKFSKKKLAAAEQGELRPITKPDVDNYVKAVKDACNKVIWNDDSQVVDLYVGKYYSENPRVHIRILEL
ncbi:RusA family crossover junction endodeoxyribonuclease [Bacillus sp. B-jedd]|uniref:RusA family crossover junction endodeoxyribonuclease n=1 Tax=Bacillus sp. B-jedd TaxID=1476857 RepID=UPI000515551D|nr:RusA family crossover junction endodeoxyribonuclease [Bacillus sp. B-jedd]CEG28107.1 endodeoxyribonuclease RusA [Bacillus sp. B-jedd]